MRRRATHVRWGGGLGPGQIVGHRPSRPAALGSFVRDFPVLLRRNLLVGYRIDSYLHELGATKSPTIVYSEHHLSHAAAAFFPSPFDTAAVLTVDGIGEWATATIGQGM